MNIKFIKSLFIFLFPLLILFACAEYFLSATENIYTIKKRSLEQKADSLQVLITGTSQAFNSLNPAVFKKPSLNVAGPAQALYYDCKIISNYLPELKSLRVVIIPVDYLTLFLDADNSYYHSLEYYRFWHIDNPILSKSDFRRYSWFVFFGPMQAKEIILKIMEQKKRNIQLDVGDMLDNGFRNLASTSDTSGFEEMANKKIARWHHELLFARNFAGNTQRLSEIIDALQAKNIKVLLLSIPVTKNFYSKYNSVFVSMTDSFLKKITTRYANTEYADFTADPDFTTSDFNDPNHLNAKGAAKFSTIIRDNYINKMIP